jgi:hypothetical protein
VAGAAVVSAAGARACGPDLGRAGSIWAARVAVVLWSANAWGSWYWLVAVREVKVERGWGGGGRRMAPGVASSRLLRETNGTGCCILSPSAGRRSAGRRKKGCTSGRWQWAAVEVVERWAWRLAESWVWVGEAAGESRTPVLSGVVDSGAYGVATLLKVSVCNSHLPSQHAPGETLHPVSGLDDGGASLVSCPLLRASFLELDSARGPVVRWVVLQRWPTGALSTCDERQMSLLVSARGFREAHVLLSWHVVPP